MKGTVILGCRGLWDSVEKPSEDCIVLDEKLFCTERCKQVNADCYVQTAFSIAKQGFTVLISYGYKNLLAVERIREENEDVEVAAFFPQKDKNAAWIKHLYNYYQKVQTENACELYYNAQNNFKNDYSTIATSHIKLYTTDNMRTFSLTN